MYKINTIGVTLVDATQLTASELVRLFGNALKQGAKYEVIGYVKVDAVNNADGSPRVPEYTGLLLVDKDNNEVITGIATATGTYFEPTGKGTETIRKQIAGSCINSTSDIVSRFGKKVIVKDFQEVDVLRNQSDKVTRKKLPIFVDETAKANKDEKDKKDKKNKKDEKK